MKHSTWKRFQQIDEALSEAISKLDYITEQLALLPNTLKSELQIMNQEIADAIARAATTITDSVTTAVNAAVAKETQDVKDLIASGGSPADVVAAIDQLATNVSNSLTAASTAAIDKVSVDASAPPPPPAPNP